VFKREGDKVRLFLASEMTKEMADPGQDPRDAPGMATLGRASITALADAATIGIPSSVIVSC
jgi:hypothetical protein